MKRNNKFKILGKTGPYYSWPNYVAVVKFNNSKYLAEIAVLYEYNNETDKYTAKIKFAYFPHSKNFHIPNHTWKSLERHLNNIKEINLPYIELE